MIVVQLGDEEIHLEPEEWQRWIEDGRIPPEAWVRFPGQDWTRARTIPGYSTGVAPALARPSRGPSLRDVLFPRRGVSATEFFLLVNLATFAVLLVVLGRAYSPTIFDWTTRWWSAVSERHAFLWWIPTLFLHADGRHLANNMVALLVSAGAVEFLAGRLWTYLLYFITGVTGMVVSYMGHGGPPLSIGASGAIYGLAGAAIVLVVRHRHGFTYRQRWKAWRVYVPLFFALALPSLLQADYWGHAGGLISGILIGFVVPPHARVLELGGSDAFAEASA
jgi:membrane associated rhomboid family serine protease